MSDFVTLTCPNCGGKLSITEDIERFSCAHCGTEHVVKRGGGIVSLAPVLESVSKGVDSTASELALVRLEKEIERVKIELSNIDLQITKRDNARGIGALGVVLIILGIIIWVSSECGSVSLVLIIPGLLMLMGFATKGPSAEEQALLVEKLKQLNAEHEHHHGKVSNNKGN